jgi:hypothetical protein
MENRGTGAGGAGTNVSGLAFEEKTANDKRLEESGFIMTYEKATKTTRSCVMKKDTTVFMMQGGLKQYMKETYGVSMIRNPDEAYLVERPTGLVLKILEKKNQNVSGSVEDKLLAGPGFLEEYAWCLKDAPRPIKVEYAFCLSNYFKSNTPKWQAFREMNKKYGITVLYGEDETYFETLDAWIQA